MSTNRHTSLSNVNVFSNGGSSYSSSQRELVHEQLERILASSLFRNSKRFPDFLRYTVNHALSGETQGVKERTLGVAVFGRDPNYDTAADPVVRVTAAEVRKRLTHYYQTPGHEREPRIEFERGSYIPEFVFAADLARREAIETPQPPHDTTRGKKKYWIVAGSLAAAVLSIFLLGSTRQTALDRFWNPVVTGKNAALLCIPGQDTSGFIRPTSVPVSPEETAAEERTSGSPGRVSLGDSEALALISGALGSRGKEFHVRASDSIDLDDLKDGPVVLIGGFSNRWTLRLTTSMRFTFVHENSAIYIADAQNPSSRAWSVSRNPAPPPDAIDYGLISRVLDATTGRAMVTVAGLHHFGTEAAAECLIDQSCMEAAAKLAPGDWKKANLQVVLKTTVIGGNSGQPQVIAAYLW